MAEYPIVINPPAVFTTRRPEPLLTVWNPPARLEMPQPERPICPDYGFPSLPVTSDRCANPWIETYDVACSPEAIECLMFRSKHYRWRQWQLNALLHRRPASSVTASAKCTWCKEVLLLCIALADDTNIAHRFIAAPDLFGRTRTFLSSVLPDYGGKLLPLMFPELWLTGSGSDVIPSAHSALGWYVLSHLGPRVDAGRGAYFWQTDGGTGPIMFGRVTSVHSVRKPRPVPDPETPAVRAMNAGDLSVHIFEREPGRGVLLGSVERASGTTFCMFVGPDARECFSYERFHVAIAGAELTMDLLEAHARDWIELRYERVVAGGFRRYLEYLKPFVESGQVGLDPAELRDQILSAQRAEAQAAVSTTGATIAAIASAFGPVGQVVGAVIALVTALLVALLEILPQAWGGGGCPVMGFRRTLTDSACSAPIPQGMPTILNVLPSYERAVAIPSPPGSSSSTIPVLDPAVGGGGAAPTRRVPVVPLLAAALATAGVLGLVASRRRSRREVVEEEQAE